MTDRDPLDIDEGVESIGIGRGGVPRDRWDRPLLKPRGVPARAAYTAASSLADFITNQRAVHLWEQRYLARGMGMREDLAALAGAESYNTGFAETDVGENKASGRRLDEIIARALDTARVHEKADYGTAAHLLTEPGQREAGGYVPERMRPDVDAFFKATKGLSIVATELFVANDRFMVAGTFDHLVDGDIIQAVHPHLETAGQLVVVDKKFGHNIKPGPFAVQTSMYAGGELYNVEDDSRMTFEEAFGKPVCQKWGLIASIPAGTGAPQLLPVDLEAGREAAEHAVWIRDWQKRHDQLAAPLDSNALERAKIIRLITQAPDGAAMSDIFRRFADAWTPEFTKLGQERLASLA